MGVANKIFSSRTATPVEQFIGSKGRLFYDEDTGSIYLSDGVTLGGIPLSFGGGGGSSNYTLPTATTTIKGGVKIDGATIAINGSGVISVSSVPYSIITGAPQTVSKLSDLTNDVGFITSVTWNDITSKPSFFSGAYSDLTGKPTAVSAFTNDAGYLTSNSLSSYATQSYVGSQGYITLSSLTWSNITGKPVLATVATSGSYTDLSNKPVLFSGSYTDLTNKPTLFSGSYTDLTNKPTIPAIPSNVSSFTNDSGYLTESKFDLNTINYDSNNKLHATGILPGDASGFTAVYAGRAAGAASLPNTVIQSQAQVNDYAQNNFQNTQDGTHASTEWVATSPNGSDTEYYVDLGINGASWDGTSSNSLYNNVGQRDGWLYVQGGNAGGGNLVIGTSVANTYTKIISGNAATGDREVARFTSTEVKLKKPLTFNDNTTQTTAWLGTYSYNNLTDKPTLVTSYNDLTDKPTLFSGSYTDLTNKPTLFSGSYTDLTNKPTLFSGNYNDLTNKPVTVQTLGNLTDVDFTTPPTVGQVLKFDGTKWAPGIDITSGGAGTDASTLSGQPSSYYLNYNNLTNTPTIPTTVTVNGTSISLGSSATITVNSISASGFTSVLGFDAGGSLILSNTNKFRSPSGLIIETGTSPLKDWTFGTDGTLTFPDATVQSTAYTGNAATVTNGVYTTDTGTVTNTMLAGSIANAKLANSSVTVNGTSISLGASATVTAAAGTLTGTTLNSTVVSSSLTSVGTLTSLTSSGTVTINNAGVTAHGSGQLYINGSTYSRIDFGPVYADPVASGRSTGTRLLLNPGTGLGRMDCAIGMSSTNLWSSVQDPNFNFSWHAGDGNLGSSPVTLLTLSGAGVLTVPGGATVSNGAATAKGLLIGTHGSIHDDGNLHVHSLTGTLWLNAMDGSDVNIGSQVNSGALSNVNIGKNLVVNGGSVTANAAAAFIAGANAVSNVSLQMPSESALRNLTNGFTNMYFDVSIGGSAHGAFKFRSSSSYTDVLIMSPTAVSFNTGATVTARSASLARTAWNSAIDTEITVDDYRFRISNQGGIFPQVISNTSGSKNTGWTGVGAISGTAVTQVGSTGTIISNSAWTTLYNAHGMDSAADTITVTLQDKSIGRIYRITFMRSDNGATTGYNIIGERLL